MSPFREWWLYAWEHRGVFNLSFRGTLLFPVLPDVGCRPLFHRGGQSTPAGRRFIPNRRPVKSGVALTGGTACFLPSDQEKRGPRGAPSQPDCAEGQPCAALATSAAKSSSFFSMPSPTSRRTKPAMVVPASLAAASTVRSGFITKA